MDIRSKIVRILWMHPVSNVILLKIPNFLVKSHKKSPKMPFNWLYTKTRNVGQQTSSHSNMVIIENLPHLRVGHTLPPLAVRPPHRQNSHNPLDKFDRFSNLPTHPAAN